MYFEYWKINLLYLIHVIKYIINVALIYSNNLWDKSERLSNWQLKNYAYFLLLCLLWQMGLQHAMPEVGLEEG